ncbi:enoyl-CoA hydratase/isomerase family protein [Achromobacter sp. GG226]|uniref:enoyl-CoA hydratase/isomerase family protein n=1 Tax=Verticiella alkaliphila TaxID=2779529 RepID=UPI001C0B52C8|nr:enoyl-CoA hydratase-related protein [Verticiella sp. GG226]MBU4611941.1 enoyl-CoA hydratase/isomerase family protein [Verticiella sp. GG226]
MSDAMIVERHGAVTVFRLNQPASRNALSFEMKNRLIAEVPAFLDDASARCLVITGSDGVFCAGGDIRTMKGEQTAASVRARMASSHAWLSRLMTTEKPIIAAVNGPAVGAGLSLALLGDIVMSSEDAYFMGGFAKLGVVPDLGLAYSLARSVGAQRAKEVLLANRKILPAEALAMGMISRVVPTADLERSALELAQQLADGPATSLGLTKLMVNSAYRTPAEYLEQEAFAQVMAFNSPEFREGVDAFLNKRPPVFNR